MTSRLVKPVFQYPGSKVRLAKAIVELLGPHDGYFEPYVGSAAVLLAKPRATVEHINDAHDLLVQFYEVLRDRHTRYALIDALVDTPYAESELRRCLLDDTGADPVERARRFFVRTNQRYSGGQGNWTLTTDPSSGHTNASKWMNYKSRLHAVSERLQAVQVSCRDAVGEIERYVATRRPGTVTAIYADPPYLMATRNGAKYTVDSGDAAHHEAMLDALVRFPGPVVISAYPNPLYDDRLGPLGWARITRASNANSQSGKGSVSARQEILWANPMCVLPERPVPLPEEAANLLPL